MIWIFLLTLSIGFVGYLVYAIVKAIIFNASNNRRLKTLAEERRQKILEFKASGFRPTRKFHGSGRMFDIDENHGKWYVMDRYINPKETVMHTISEIRSAEKASNKEYAGTSGAGVIMLGGIVLNNSQIQSYYSKLGVVVKLNNKDRPVEFINCYEDESDADRILSFIEILIDENKKPPPKQGFRLSLLCLKFA